MNEYENENIPRYRSGRVTFTGSISLTLNAATELRRLFDLVADTCDAAGEILGRAGPPPKGTELDRLREVTVRVDTMVDRIKAILG